MILRYGMCVVALAVPCDAATLPYTSHPLKDFGSGAGEGQIEATFDMGGTALTPGALLSERHISSWTIFAGGRTFTDELLAQADPSLLPWFEARFLIGDEGIPIEWAFSSELQMEAVFLPEAIVSFNSVTIDFGSLLPRPPPPVSGDGLVIDDAAVGRFGAAPSVDGDPVSAAALTSPGVWSFVPEPGRPSLLCVGFIVLAVRRSRRRL